MFNLNKNLLRQALDLSPVATVIVDTHKPFAAIAYVNQAFEAMSGFDAGELIGRRWHELLAESPNNDLADKICESAVELECHPRLGVAERLSLNMLPLFDRPGTPRFWMGTENQAVELDESGNGGEKEALLAVLRDARVHLRQLDGRDSTTGVLNRRAFDDILRRDWVLARRDQRALTLMLFQLDSFDEYREVFGRHAADSCLQKVAHSINGSLRRASDLVTRFSDNQFAVLVAHGDEAKLKEFSVSIAAKVRGLSIHHPRSTADRFVTVSIGVASVLPAGAMSADELIEKAQESLASGGAPGEIMAFTG